MPQKTKILREKQIRQNMEGSAAAAGAEEPAWQASSMDDLLRNNPAMAKALQQAAAKKKEAGPQMGDITHGDKGQSTMGWIGDERSNAAAGLGDDIFTAAGAGDRAAVAAYLRAGAGVEGTDADGRTALHWSVDRGHAEVARFLLEECAAAVDAVDGEGQTALHYATLCEHPPIARLLVSKGAALGAVDADGATPMDNCEDEELAAELQQLAVEAAAAGAGAATAPLAGAAEE